MKRGGRRWGIGVLLALAAAVCAFYAATRWNLDPAHGVGDIVDALDGVAVFHNGGVAHTAGRNLAPDGYNLGIRYQCVEFVKRYYYERYGHAMPDSYGHARDFYDPAVADGARNVKRGLLQFRNGGAGRPARGDLVVFSPWIFNRYGHVAIVSEAGEDEVEIVQQNPGPFGRTRERLSLVRTGDGGLRIGHRRVRGWLRMEPR